MKKLLSSLIIIALFSSTAFGAVPSKKDKKTSHDKNHQEQELTRKQVEEIAEKYIKAISEKDYVAWSSLMVSTKRVSEKEFREFYLKEAGLWRPFEASFNRIKKIEVRKVRDNSAILDVYTVFSGDEVGIRPAALLLLPDGKIKYDAFIVRHPLLIAKSSAGNLYGSYSRNVHPNAMSSRNAPKAALFKSGVPLFGFDEPNASKDDRSRALNKILKWISKNSNEWDSSEPKVYLPKEITQKLF